MRPFPSYVWVGAFFALTLSYSVLSQTVYDKVTSAPPASVPSCMYDAETTVGSYLNTKFNEYMDTYGSRFGTCDDSYPRTCYSYPSGASLTVTPRPDSNYCDGKLTYDYEMWQSNNTNPKYNTQQKRMNFTHSGTMMDNDQCPPEGNQNFDKKLMSDSSGQSMCYDPEELAENDSCENLNPTNEHLSTNGVLSCVKLSDGSACPVKRSGSMQSAASGETTYFYHTDSSADQESCYNNKAQETETPIPQEPDNYCEAYNGVLMCNESESAMCPNGECPAGCGNVNFGSGSKFVCLDGDIDSDMVPNYSDPDVDNDGIPNSEDPDWDGDGINDPAYGTGRPGSAGSEGQDGGSGSGNGTGGSGSADSGASATEIGEELKDKLTELGDFSTTDFEAAIDAKNAAYDTKLEEFSNNENLEFTRAISESSIEDDLNLGEYFSGSSCNANIAIPLTTQSLDLCEPLQKAQPYLYVIFALSTFWHCITLIVGTLRGTE